MTLHSFRLPAIALPAIEMPSIEMPVLEMPVLALPEWRLPRLARRRLMLGLALGLATLVHAPAPARAAEAASETALRAAVTETIAPWAQDKIILSALAAANTQRESLTPAAIEGLDATWAAETKASTHPTIDAVIANPVADFLREHQHAAQGRIVEVILMDNHGLNVAATDVTSDMWQGDEAKFTETFPKGVGAMHFGEVDFDDSTGLLVVQVSLTIVDPATNQPLGAMTVGFDASSL
ncbi:hypothetical protein V8J36_13005 [Frigidibacter sp. MR17.14]|uniref:hypothetical protein n=1 Tax=Frigidibacter sp. MR17.14 TaxID=3126509 RepID=UPI0030129CDC